LTTLASIGTLGAVGRIGEEWDERTYQGIGPHRADPRTVVAATEVISLIEEALPGTRAEHIGSTAVLGLDGKNVVDLQITADPGDVVEITEALLGLGFVRQRGRDPWPPERPMLEGTYQCDGAVLALHCHVVPTTDPDVRKMIEFRDLLRADAGARESYVADKRRIAALTDDPLAYTHDKTALINLLLSRQRATSV
jgi:dephospho-CoA kinase